MISEIKKFVKDNADFLLFFIVILLIITFSFSLGYIAAKMEEKESLRYEEKIQHEESYLYYKMKS